MKNVLKAYVVKLQSEYTGSYDVDLINSLTAIFVNSCTLTDDLVGRDVVESEAHWQKRQ